MWDKADYEFAYWYPIKKHGEPVRWVTYGREFADKNWNMYQVRWDLLELAGVQKSDRVLIVGCGFGYLIEEALSRGYENVWGTDISTWIQSEIAVEGSVADRVIFGDIVHRNVRKALRGMTGGETFNWVVTEQVMETTPSEVPLYQACEAAQEGEGSVVHLVAAERDGTSPVPGFEMKRHRLNEWKTRRNNHMWIDTVQRRLIPVNGATIQHTDPPSRDPLPPSQRPDFHETQWPQYRTPPR